MGLLNLCTIVSFGESLASNSKGPMKYVSRNSHPCKT